MSTKVDLSTYRNPLGHDKGRGIVVRSIWHVVNALAIKSTLNPSSSLRIIFLRLFGASIGPGAIIKPGVNIKHPWFLRVGENSWIGEDAWIDNTYAPITIGSNVCISQAAYLCTGNHDWTDTAFGLIEKPLTIEDGAWIGARACVLPGAFIAKNVVVASGSVISKITEPDTIYNGNPAVAVKKRVIR